MGAYSLSRLPLQRYFCVSETMTPLKKMSEMRFGMAIRPLAMSAKDQTDFSVTTEPTITAITHSHLYGLITLQPKRYSAAFSP